MSQSHEIELAETFAEIARGLLAERSLDATLQKIVTTAVTTIDGCEAAGISYIERRTLTTRAASGDVPRQVDAIQYEVNQGPCLDAIRDHEVFTVDDLTTDERWPLFSRRAAAETGTRSMLAFRLFANEDTMGALNLFSSSPAAFGQEAQTVGGVFAAHAAVALSSAKEIAGLHEAMESRAVIEQAKGIIMAARRCSADEAFDLLREQSQALNEKLREVANGIVDQQQQA